jgi:hypothetical protein
VTTKSGQRNPLLIWMASGVIAYALVSGGLALATANECGGKDGVKHWVLIPPGWECGQ